MKRRWFIRSLVAIPFLVCVVAWAVSEWHWCGPGYHNGRRSSWDLWLNRGAISLWKFRDNEIEHWEWLWSPAVRLPDFRNDSIYELCGFAIGKNTGGYTSFVMVVPLWFPTLASAIVLLWTWRKTGTKAAGGAFPMMEKSAENAGTL
jgi:hypothetical protein